MSRAHLTDERGEELGECGLRVVVARGRCPRLFVTVPTEDEARLYRLHPDDAVEPLTSRLRILRDGVRGELTLTRRTEHQAGSAYARGM